MNYESFEFIGWAVIIILFFVLMVIIIDKRDTENHCRPIDLIIGWECNKENLK